MPKKLTKMPIDVEALLSSNRLARMKDYQRWWYMKALLKMWNQIHPGYLEMNGQLWTMLDSHSSQFFYGGEPRRCDVVLECFQVRELDGNQYLYSHDVERRWSEQQKKYSLASERGRKGGAKISLSRVSIDSNSLELIYKDYPRHKNPKTAKEEINKAIKRIQEKKLVEYQDRFGKTRFVPIENDLDATQFLHEAVLEFKESPEGRKEQKYILYPERWFKRECYLEPRSEWFVEEAQKKSKGLDLGKLYGEDDPDDNS